MSREAVMLLVYTTAFAGTCWLNALFRSLRHKFDPLDREILERTFDATFAAVKGDECPVDFDRDEGLEAILRRELIEIACITGVSDPETLKDRLLVRLPLVQHRRRGEVLAKGERPATKPWAFPTHETGH